MALKAGLPMVIENFQEMRIKGKKGKPVYAS